MNIERFRKIIKYNDAHRMEIESKVQDYYSFAQMSSEKDVLNMKQIARSILKKRGYFIFEIPFADNEIGALCYKGDAFGYIVLNTSLPKVNVNFALCHELYHVFYQKSEFRTKVEFSNKLYDEYQDEFSANLFASMLLMPEASFRLLYYKFKEESDNDEKDTIIRLMNYYQVPYMAALIRCYELGLPKENSISEKLLNVEETIVKERFRDLWLDDSILCATKKDDYQHMELLVERLGEEYVKDSYLNRKTVEKVLRNMRLLYHDIKGE